MKKFAIFCLILCIAGSVFCFVGCGNNDSDTDIDLNSLYERISELQKESEKTVAALTARISSLETELSDANKEISSLRSEVTRLSELSSTLSQTITELTDIVEDEASGNEALKAKLDTLQAQYEQTKSAVDSLSAKVSSLESNIGSLQSELDEATLRIDAIEGAVAADKTYTYNMGEECVVKAASGLELFRVKLIEYNIVTQGADYFELRFQLQKLYLPANVEMERYFNVIAYDSTNNKYYSRDPLYSNSDYTNYEQIYTIGFNMLPSNITHFIVGLTSAVEYESSSYDTRNYIIPYAIYNNTSAST